MARQRMWIVMTPIPTFFRAPEICDGFENACIPGAPVDDAFKDTDLDGLKDCVDLEIDQYLVVQYVENSTEFVVCDQLTKRPPTAWPIWCSRRWQFNRRTHE